MLLVLLVLALVLVLLLLLLLLILIGLIIVETFAMDRMVKKMDLVRCLGMTLLARIINNI